MVSGPSPAILKLDGERPRVVKGNQMPKFDGQINVTIEAATKEAAEARLSALENMFDFCDDVLDAWADPNVDESEADEDDEDDETPYPDDLLSDSEARTIASFWAEGGDLLQQFQSTGYIHGDLLSMVVTQAGLCGLQFDEAPDARALNMLAAYIRYHGERPPVEGWWKGTTIYTAEDIGEALGLNLIA